MRITSHLKNTIKKIGIIIALVLLSAPGIARAQYYYWGQNNDGSSDTNERVRTYRRQSSEMQQQINALDDQIEEDIRMPILFGVGVNDISPNFGDPRDGGSRTHMGEDIMAVKGTPIVSPTEAVVLRTVNGTTEGYTVYTANPGGETFVYMHLDRFGEGVSSGDVLSPGDLIGYAGNTGNASGGPAHLHFEIHEASREAIDPFPRLTAEFTLAQKIQYLSKILDQSSDSTALADLLAVNFRGTFTAAIAEGISLPAEMTAALARIPAYAVTPSTSGLPSGDLTLGSSGAAVVALQKYLIAAAKDGAAMRLASAGATGNFGPITQAALVEFQVAVGISPASGYYGATTRAFIESHPISGIVSPTPPAPTGIPSSTSGALLRDLSVGSVGEDVRTLQRVLRAHGFAVVPAGSETTYFGTLTQSAVIKFQISRGITPASGYVGPQTRYQLGILR